MSHAGLVMSTAKAELKAPTGAGFSNLLVRASSVHLANKCNA